MAASGADVPVVVDGRRMTLRNLDKVLYPSTGTTKGEVLHYVSTVAPVLLPHLAGRPVTRMRWPDGVGAEGFVEKQVPRGAPSWLRTMPLGTPGSAKGREIATFPFVDDLPGLVWAANLAALELHVPQWTVGPRGAFHGPDRLVVDLDPGAPAGLPECAEVALAVRERLAADGLDAYPVTSGGAGMQLYAPVSGRQDAEAMREYARHLAESLERDLPRLVVSRMTKELRRGRVLLDWSQNHPGKTTISPYSLRGRERPTVAAPRTWQEVEDGSRLTQLTWADVLDRVRAFGDLVEPLLTPGPRVPLPP